MNGSGGVVEGAAGQVSLASMSCAVERHRVQVHPRPVGRDELDPDRPPVGFQGVTEQAQGGQRGSLVLSVYGQVQVPVRPRLPSEQRVDSPTASYPEFAARRSVGTAITSFGGMPVWTSPR